MVQGYPRDLKKAARCKNAERRKVNICFQLNPSLVLVNIAMQAVKMQRANTTNSSKISVKFDHDHDHDHDHNHDHDHDHDHDLG